MTATLIILAVWVAFVWFCDPDDFGSRDRSKPTCKPSGLTKPSDS